MDGEVGQGLGVAMFRARDGEEGRPQVYGDVPHLHSRVADQVVGLDDDVVDALIEGQGDVPLLEPVGHVPVHTVDGHLDTVEP